MNAATVRLALELELGTLVRAILFVAVVAAVVPTVANGRARCAISVCTLECARTADAGWTLRRFVRSIFAILFTVASTKIEINLDLHQLFC